MTGDSAVPSKSGWWGQRMIEEHQRPRLGRGLAALIGEVGEEFSTPERARSQRKLPISFLRSNPRNPRKAFDEAELAGLADSIRAKGVIQPILVRATGTRDVYEIVAGERRWRAAQVAGLHDVPVIIVDVSDRDALEMALVENVQRTDLNPLEEAQAYEQLLAEFDYSHGDLGAVIGKSRSHVANTLRLLKLPDRVKGLVADGRLSAGHARALLSASDPERLAELIIEREMSVREVEALVQVDRPDARARPQRPEPDADIRALERTLSDVLGLQVGLRHRGSGGGELRIVYRTLEQLDDVCRRLKG